jgi:long-subunit acyl-CoA synthetase (AMP-forming)
MEEGKDLSDVSDDDIKVNIDDCYTFSYTSGTTGPPKAAMISHKNVLSFVNAFRSH